MSTEEWAQTTRQDQYWQAPEHQRAITILKSVFDGQLEPERGAREIASTYEPLLNQVFSNSPVNQLWGMICEAAQILGGDHNIDGHIISFLDALSYLPDVTDTHNNPITGGEMANSSVYWRDLPALAITLRIYAFGKSQFPLNIKPKSHAHTSTDIDPDESPESIPTRQNVATFGALYLASGKNEIGMSNHAEGSLLESIETPYETVEQRQRASVVIPPAVIWILLAGEKIRALCQADHGRNDSKGRGYSLGRWAIWKTAFGEIARNEALDDGIRDVASKAVDEMERIERKA